MNQYRDIRYDTIYRAIAKWHIATKIGGIPDRPMNAVQLCRTTVLLTVFTQRNFVADGKSSESVQCAMLKVCDACADMGQL